MSDVSIGWAWLLRVRSLVIVRKRDVAASEMVSAFSKALNGEPFAGACIVSACLIACCQSSSGFLQIGRNVNKGHLH